jgi:hypothetical protein
VKFGLLKSFLFAHFDKNQPITLVYERSSQHHAHEQSCSSLSVL